MYRTHPLRSLPADQRAQLGALIASEHLVEGPDSFAVMRGDQVIGGFALSALRQHGVGRRIAAAIGGPRQVRFPGPHGIVHGLALRDFDRRWLEHVMAAIARRSLARMYGTIFFCASDRRSSRVLRTLGVELPADLAGIAPVVAAFQPGRADNLARLASAAA